MCEWILINITKIRVPATMRRHHSTLTLNQCSSINIEMNDSNVKVRCVRNFFLFETEQN